MRNNQNPKQKQKIFQSCQVVLVGLLPCSMALLANSSKIPASWHYLLSSFLMYTYHFPVSRAAAILPACLDRPRGIVPLRKLVLRSNRSKLRQSPNSAGIFPDNELFLSFKIARFDHSTGCLRVKSN